MNGNSILNVSLVEKNIEKIQLYADDEKKVLINIYRKIKGINSCYNSDNMKKIINNIDELGSGISIIYRKRMEYIDTLESAIKIYTERVEQTKLRFGETKLW